MLKPIEWYSSQIFCFNFNCNYKFLVEIFVEQHAKYYKIISGYFKIIGTEHKRCNNGSNDIKIFIRFEQYR